MGKYIIFFSEKPALTGAWYGRDGSGVNLNVVVDFYHSEKGIGNSNISRQARNRIIVLVDR